MAITTALLDLEEQRCPYMAITTALLDLEEQRCPYMAITTGTAGQGRAPVSFTDRKR
jgi:TusA-related sulfurtransferase